MSFPQHLRRALVACVLLGAAFGTAALTIGRSRGVALIGRPLDVSIPLTLDNASQAADLCAEADVFHGDTRVDASRVTALVENAGGTSATVRVRASVAVDEPVVTVYLRLGCNQKYTRRYVLLAEEPGDFVPPAAAVPAPPQAAPTRPLAAPPVVRSRVGPEFRAQPRAALGSRNTSRARRNAQSETSPRGAAVASLETSLAPERGTERPQRRASSARGGRSRLQVDPLDLSPAQDLQLRVTPRLADVPSTDAAVRAQAAALWRAINAQPEDVLRNLQRLQALEAEVNGLRTVVTSNDRTLNELREEVSQWRQTRRLTLAAIALLALLLAAVVVTWLRRGERAGSGEWWRRSDAAGEAQASAAARETPFGSPALPREINQGVDQFISDALKQSASGAAVTISAAAPDPAFRSNMQSLESMRMTEAEDMLDIQQQADFFMVLGLPDQAIAVMERQVRNYTETSEPIEASHRRKASALAWLDLLAIYRAHKRQEDYQLLRTDFQRLFTAEEPDDDTPPTALGALDIDLTARSEQDRATMKPLSVSHDPPVSDSAQSAFDSATGRERRRDG